MNTFADDVKAEYPELADQLIEQYGNVGPAVIKVPHRVPGYVLPILLTILVAVFYIASMHVKNKVAQIPREKHVAEIEQRLVEMQTSIDKHTLAIHLLAILHNEDFASVRQATGNQDLIFINKDWTIDQLPKYLKLPKEEKERIARQFLRPKQAAPNDNGSSVKSDR